MQILPSGKECIIDYKNDEDGNEEDKKEENNNCKPYLDTLNLINKKTEIYNKLLNNKNKLNINL